MENNELQAVTRPRGSLPFDQRPGESDKAFAAFSAFAPGLEVDLAAMPPRSATETTQAPNTNPEEHCHA